MVQIQEEEDAIEQQTTKPYSNLSQHKSTIKNQMESTTSHQLPTTTTTPPAAAESPTSSISSIDSDHTFKETYPSPPPSPTSNPNPVQSIVTVQAANRLVHDQPEMLTKSEPEADTGFTSDVKAGPDKRQHQKLQQRRQQRRPKNGKLVKTAGLVLRFFEFVLCLISFAVMAADKNRGWADDSFDRYIEFRYAMSVNVIGFAYSGLQGLDLLLHLTTGKGPHGQIRYCFDFASDQILAYLLLSASSSAFTRVDDWISNWGNDKFPAMATASIGVSFVAFIAFALTSIISGYQLCTHKFT